ncbi:hypothetical protein PR202_gb03522 [Eleusine coracana subsp. coracana]|uniref:Uncharacterized protein n=1 Tax=Eleusine coracana subsp. coracana TaxID=191504 RepID=A0AAV5E209_ELECO|nr:hypothetical protein PR202_gb03522 [Eleusine coracana subsp. coracana]
MDMIIEERDQAIGDADIMESELQELQVEFDAFKATHLPIIDNWDEIPMEYGKQVDEEMEQAENGVICSMVRTRNQDDPESSQQGANAQPSLADVVAAALCRQQNNSELLRRLVDITSHLAGHGGNHNNNQPRQCPYTDFLGTHPPTFERAREPLDADHWLRKIESKFGLLDCTEPCWCLVCGMSFELPFKLISYHPVLCRGCFRSSWT